MGLMVPATRQKAGILGIGFTFAARVGGVNSPAGRDSAMVTLILGNARTDRLSQVAAWATPEATRSRTNDGFVTFQDGSAVEGGATMI